MTGAVLALPTTRVTRPAGTQPDHLHLGGLCVVTPSNTLRAATWLPERDYRITYTPVSQRWYVQVDDDLHWTTLWPILTIASGIAHHDAPSNPDGTPLLCRYDTYLVRHQERGTSCHLTISNPSRA